MELRHHRKSNGGNDCLMLFAVLEHPGSVHK